MNDKKTNKIIQYALVLLCLVFVLIVWIMPDSQAAIKKSVESIIPQKKPVYDTIEIEQKLLEAINTERQKHGIQELKWNPEIAKIARTHSSYLASNNTGMHNEIKLTSEDQKGGLLDSRLRKAGIYYWSNANEITHATSSVKSFSRFFNNSPTAYHSFDEVVTALAHGIINNSEHEKYSIIINNEFNEVGIGVSTDQSGINYIATLDFIKRVECGYPSRSCCVEQGYLPYCFEPFECVEMKCT